MNVKTACILWYDTGDPQYLPFLRMPLPEVRDEEVMGELLQHGYTLHKATKRARTPHDLDGKFYPRRSAGYHVRPPKKPRIRKPIGARNRRKR